MPFWSDTAERVVPDESVIVTVAFGTTAPVGSVIVPWREAVWEKQVPALITAIAKSARNEQANSHLGLRDVQKRFTGIRFALLETAIIPSEAEGWLKTVRAYPLDADATATI